MLYLIYLKFSSAVKNTIIMVFYLKKCIIEELYGVYETHCTNANNFTLQTSMFVYSTEYK